MYYDHKLPNGKNNKIVYYLVSYLRLVVPNFLFRMCRERALRNIHNHPDRNYILQRIDYHNKLSAVTPLPDDAVEIGGFTKKVAIDWPGNANVTQKSQRRYYSSVYFFDTIEYLRWFPRSLRIKFLFGDIITVPTCPSIVKSRPIGNDNANSVTLNLVKLRHFTFIDDKKSFREKNDTAIFRGHILGKKPHRRKFVEMFFGHPMCDVGIISPTPDMPAEWSAGKKITLWQHLEHKFILTLEGNDVASNLKWVMSSNSVAVMPRPRYETWFMEGRLIPGFHYIEIREDYSDLEERLNYYLAHPEEAEAIIDNAHSYVEQFLNSRRERLISLGVLDKYFRMTGQQK